MSTLREAAQAALEHWDKVSGIFRMTTETNRLRAALAQPETTAEPVAWLNRYHAAMVTQDHATAVAMGFTTPLYASPPCDEWRPASEPPEDGRQVLGWQKRGYWDAVHFLNGNWFVEATGRHTLTITHWRDVQPPTEVAK
mgnify:CR=1 FL=1